MKKYESIEDCLKDGYKLHAFRSGGGLRVIRVDKTDDDRFYGESCDWKNALRILLDDIKAGHREYEDVYGEDKLEPHYWTGGWADPEDNFDTWLYQGHVIDAMWNGKAIVVTLPKSREINTPKVLSEIIFKLKPTETISWRYLNVPELYDVIFTGKTDRLPSGSQCINVSRSKDTNIFIYIDFIATDKTFKGALHKAMKSALVEHELQYEFVLPTLNTHKTN